MNTGSPHFYRAGHINTFQPSSHLLQSFSWLVRGIKQCYRLAWRKQIPGQGKGLSEGVSSVCLIEHSVVNCLCVGGEKSICFLAAMTSRPWGERLKLADTDTHAKLCQINHKTMPCKHKLTNADPDHSSIDTHTHTQTHMHIRSSEEEDVHEGLLSRGKVRSIYRLSACWERRGTWDLHRSEGQETEEMRERKREKNRERNLQSLQLPPPPPILSECRASVLL